MKYKKLISTLAITSLLLPAGIVYANPGNGNDNHSPGQYTVVTAGGANYGIKVKGEDKQLEDESEDRTTEDQDETRNGKEIEPKEQEIKSQEGARTKEEKEMQGYLEKEITGLQVTPEAQAREENQVREETQNAGLVKFQSRIRVKNKEIKFDVPPVIKGNRTLIPVRAVTQGLGATVNWDAATNTVTITKNGITVVLIPGSTEVTVNDTKINLDVPAALISNRTFVPLRFLGEVFKDKVNYDPATGDIDIEEGNENEAEQGTETPPPGTTAPESPVNSSPTTSTVPTGTSPTPPATTGTSTPTTPLPQLLLPS
ncbi:copper amine oxidase N-terminal domain-containing protein [Moorella sp. Hama-1]|uniref:copper amine oxidase N-terminal domain-containing protein n=1 Tax=Moorella sp. Hama-1 TaxID=2138101 RepID=UPI000D64C52E|nr:copper amine oxidase N-terminal domain-containing protein [Moorella sp. Hama-1]BCV21738.1 copper amine oxidase-like protein [Moorella sp. Hama-1]